MCHPEPREDEFRMTLYEMQLCHFFFPYSFRLHPYKESIYMFKYLI